MSLLGSWSTNQELISELSNKFHSADPFPFVVIPEFFKADVAEKIYEKFPHPLGADADKWRDEGWNVYDNPIEGKLTIDDVDKMAEYDVIFNDMWNELESTELIDIITKISGIQNLEKDPHRHGAGLHFHPPYGRLEMHLDYSIHPITQKERRLNLLIYMNKDWKDSWNGKLELWQGNKDCMTNGPVQSITPAFNQAVLFRTSDISWHGMPESVQCPEGVGRKSIAIYYVSDARTDATLRNKASFQARPNDPIRSTGYERLCDLRTTRRLTNEDVTEFMPDWKSRWQ